MKQNRFLTIICLVPLTLSFAVLYVLPLAYALVRVCLSFTSVTEALVSFAHTFTGLFTDDLFLASVRNMAIIYCGGIASFVLAFVSSSFQKIGTAKKADSAPRAQTTDSAHSTQAAPSAQNAATKSISQSSAFTCLVIRIKKTVLHAVRSLLFLPHALPSFALAAVMAYYVCNTKYGIVSSIYMLKNLQSGSALNLFFFASVCIAAIAFMSSLCASNQKRLIVPAWTSITLSLCVYPLVFSPIGVQKTTVTPALYVLSAFTDGTSPVTKRAAACTLLLMILFLALMCMLNSLFFYIKDTHRKTPAAAQVRTQSAHLNQTAQTRTQSAHLNKTARVRTVFAFLWHAAGFLVAVSLIAFAVVCIIQTVKASLSTDTEIFSRTMLSRGAQGENYRALFANKAFTSALKNSAHYALCTVLFAFLFACPAGYHISRTKTKLQRTLQSLCTLSVFVPSLFTGIFAFVFLARFTVLPTRFLLTTLYVLLVLPSSTLWFASIFGNRISKKERIARESNRSKIAVFAVCCIERKKTLATFAAALFIIIWNEYPFATLFAANTDAQAVSTALVSLIRYTRYHGSWGELFAAAASCSVPCALLFALFARRLCARPLLLFRP